MSARIQEYVATRYPIFRNFLDAIWNIAFDIHYASDEEGFRTYLDMVSLKVRYQFKEEVEKISQDKLLLDYFIRNKDKSMFGGMSFSEEDLQILLNYLRKNVL